MAVDHKVVDVVDVDYMIVVIHILSQIRFVVRILHDDVDRIHHDDHGRGGHDAPAQIVRFHIHLPSINNQFKRNCSPIIWFLFIYSHVDVDNAVALHLQSMQVIKHRKLPKIIKILLSIK